MIKRPRSEKKSKDSIDKDGYNSVCFIFKVAMKLDNI